MESTIIEIIISEAQNEIRDFQKWNFDIIPHRERMKLGFSTSDGKRIAVDDAFKDLQDEMRSQYAIGYEPTNPKKDGTFRRIEIQTNNREYKVQARKGYYAVQSE